MSSLLFTAPLVARPLAAQDTDVIRGRVTGPRGEPIARARVHAATVSGGVTRTTTTNDDGRYVLTFANGDGNYWITVTAVGYAARRLEIKRVGEEAVLPGDMRLAPSGAVLDSVRITARQRPTRDTTTTDIGGSEARPVSEVLTVDQLADLALLAGSVPGVQIVTRDDGPSGFSVLGLSPDQNQTTLNGMRFSGSSLPRDAGFAVSLAVSPYDVARGGFSGAQLALRSRPPTNIALRANSIALDAPALQWQDAGARALGQSFTNLSVGGVVTTPLRRDRWFLHTAYQISRRTSDLRTLDNTSDAGLTTLGLSPDSLARLERVLPRLGLATPSTAIPALRTLTQGQVYGSMDVLSSATSGRSLNVLYTGAWSAQAPVAFGALSWPSFGGTRTTWNAGAQMRHTQLIGFTVLSETQLAVSATSTRSARYSDLPAAFVRITSDLPTGGQTVQTVSLGGSPSLDRAQRTSLVALTNQLAWFSRDNRHRLRLTSEYQRESLDERLGSNTLGTFRFQSLADLEAGAPVMYTRQLVSPLHDIRHHRLALALSDALQPTPRLQLLAGIRVDANRFVGRPAHNVAFASVFGTRNDHVPNRVDVSPRLGFAYSYGVAPQLTAAVGAARAPRATVRGGIGVFQSVPSPAFITAPIDNTGLPSGARTLTCNGPAAPTPQWSRYADPRTIPATCADGVGAAPFVQADPPVVYYDSDFAPPRSLRGNVQWSGVVFDGRLQLQVDATRSLNLSQPSTIDRNFRNVVAMHLGGGDGRPVFVSPSSIDARTGTIAATARTSDAYGVVSALRSDLRSTSNQLSISVVPGSATRNLRWHLSYVLSRYREQTRGFSSTAGDPFSVEWSRATLDARHQIVYAVGYNLFDLVRLSWSGSFRSGLPFGAYVDGDINGDGRSNDRAFVPDPATLPAGVEQTALTTLLQSGSAAARACLRAHLRTTVARNACDGPWAANAALTVALNPVRWWRSNRVDVAMQLANPLGALDQLLHGQARQRGWGQTATVNDVLYYVRGYDAATRRFRYDVNPQFGTVAQTSSASRVPVILTAIVRVDVGPTRERQTLTAQLDRGRRDAGAMVTEAALRAMWSDGGVFNPLAAILRNADTLRLSAMQADSLTRLNARYARQVDALWAPIARDFAALPAQYSRRDAHRRYVGARRHTIDLLASIAGPTRALLTPTQRRALPAEVLAHLDPRYLATIRTGTAGLGLAFLPGIAAPTAAGGAGGSLSSGGRR